MSIEKRKSNRGFRFLRVRFWYRPLYNAATFFSSFVIARLMKSLIVMPVEATKAATRECNSDGIRRFSLPL